MKNKKLRNCSISILGDSYSTFVGYIPSGHISYYPDPEKVADVLCVEDTWWYQLMQLRNMHLLINDSYSGSTVCRNVREHLPVTSAFVERMFYSLSAREESLACIIVFGGTNDSWIEREVGQPIYKDWTIDDLQKVIPSYCYLLDYISRQNPDATIVCVINSELNPEIQGGMLNAGKCYGAICVELKGIQKENGHPSKVGMQQIAAQIDFALG